MTHLGFPQRLIDMVMQCVTTFMFSLLINGCTERYFKLAKSLRQGDPISPLLFVICVEYLSRILYKMSELDQFYFLTRCKEMDLTHMCFADDLILCCKGEFTLIYLMMQAF